MRSTNVPTILSTLFHKFRDVCAHFPPSTERGDRGGISQIWQRSCSSTPGRRYGTYFRPGVLCTVALAACLAVADEGPPPAEKQGEDRPDQAFTAGLLSDIGMLVMACQHIDEFEEVLHKVRRDQKPICQVEMDLLQLTHAEIGAYLLGLWGLPKRIVEAVALHHNPNETPYEGLCALTAVHAADVLVSEVERSETGTDGLFTPDIDESQLDVRLLFTPSTSGAFGQFGIAEQAATMTQGAVQEYFVEPTITFFVGNTIEDIGAAGSPDAGSFQLQIRSSVEGSFNLRGMTAYYHS